MNLRDVTNSFQHVVSTTFEATTTAHKLKQVVVDMETGQRGFIITGIDNYLEPYNLAENKFDKLLKQLRKNLAHRADYLDTLEEIEHLKYQWIGAAGVPEIEARRLISQTTTNRQAIESMILSGKGKKLFDKIRTLLSAISNDFKMVGKKDELQLITQISKDIVDSETGQRGFLLAGRDWFLEPYYAGQVGFTKNIKELEEMLGADSTTQKKLSEIEKLYKEWLTEIAWPEIQSRIEYEKNPRSLGDLAKLMATGTGKAIIDKLREQLDTFISKLTKEIEQVSEQAEQETQFNNLVGLIVSCAGIVLTVFLSFSLGRSIITPIRELTDGTNRIGNGDLDHKINVTSKDELGFLAQSFNKMTAELEMTTVSRDYFDNIIRSMTDSLIIISPDGNIKKVNIACSTLLGCEEKELLGQPIDYIFHDEISKSTLIPELVKKEAITNIETNYRTKNGIIIPMAFSAAAMRDKNGKLLAIVTVARNITEKKRLEKELLEKQSQLAHADRLTALGEMATGIAHEINQPLNIISLATQVIKRFFSRHHCDSLTSEAVEEIQLQVGRAATIINNMRTFARTDNVGHERINLAEPANLAISFFKEQFRLHQIKLTVVFADDLPFVTADTQKFEQVVINLLSNARYAVEKKAEDGEYQKEVSIKLFGDLKKRMVVFEITDNGTGMSAEEKEHCMEPFYSTKEVGQGTGLGMSITHNIVTSFEGSIEVESSKGIGSTFRILLPVAGNGK